MDTPPPADLPPPDQPPGPPDGAKDVPVLRIADDVPVLVPLGPPPRPPLPLSQILFLAILAVAPFVYAGLFFMGETAQRFALAGLEVLPLLGLALLAYAGERNFVFRVLSAVYWVFLIVGSIALITAFTGFAEVDVPTLIRIRDARAAGKQVAANPADFFLPGGLQMVGWTFAGCVLAGLIGVVGYGRAARSAVARVLPGFDAESFVHATALATVTALTLMLFLPLAVTGEPVLLTMIRHFTDAGGDLAAQLGDQDTLTDQVYGFVWLLPVGLLVVGWPLYRTLPAAVRRVGFVVPKWWHVPLGLGVAIVLVVVMALLDVGITRLWTAMQWPRTDETALKTLFKSMTSPLGAVVIGVTAGVGEELMVRGILQPRLGIVLSNLFFTSLHALQYSWDGLLSVFLIGLVLGLVRKRTNTTTSAIVHGSYDFTLVLAEVYQIDPSKWFGGG